MNMNAGPDFAEYIDGANEGVDKNNDGVVDATEFLEYIQTVEELPKVNEALSTPEKLLELRDGLKNSFDNKIDKLKNIEYGNLTNSDICIIQTYAMLYMGETIDSLGGYIGKNNTNLKVVFYHIKEGNEGELLEFNNKINNRYLNKENNNRYISALKKNIEAAGNGKMGIMIKEKGLFINIDTLNINEFVLKIFGNNIPDNPVEVYQKIGEWLCDNMVYDSFQYKLIFLNRETLKGFIISNKRSMHKGKEFDIDTISEKDIDNLIIEFSETFPSLDELLNISNKYNVSGKYSNLIAYLKNNKDTDIFNLYIELSKKFQNELDEIIVSLKDNNGKTVSEIINFGSAVCDTFSALQHELYNATVQLKPELGLKGKSILVLGRGGSHAYNLLIERNDHLIFSTDFNEHRFDITNKLYSQGNMYIVDNGSNSYKKWMESNNPDINQEIYGK